jgi:predicted nuclease of restriction endonuclease-like (RecB) superfamily
VPKNRQLRRSPSALPRATTRTYGKTLSGIVELIAEGRHRASRAINAEMVATYWLVGRRIVEEEQRGTKRAGYGEELVALLAQDLTRRFGRGFGERNLFRMKAFYLLKREIVSTLPTQLGARKKVSTVSTLSPGTELQALSSILPLPWSHYVLLLGVKNEHARRFYEIEALRGGWSIRQLARQIDTQFYERSALSRNKVAMLSKGAKSMPGDEVTPEQEIKDPLVLEFLDLKDEYSESELEEALIQDLETFLLELGREFAFIGRQRRLRIGDQWFRVDLLLFHRRLRCLVVIDLKLGKLTHADAGQMHLYLNYARKHWMVEGENPPVGLILCTSKDASVAEYALEGLSNKVLAAEYRTVLPSEEVLVEHLDQAREQLLSTPRRRLDH